MCPTAMHARMDEKVAAGDDGGGGLLSCYVIVLGPWLRGKHVLPRDGEAWVEAVRRLRMVKAGTWPLFLHSSTANKKLRTARGASVATDSAFEEVVNHARNPDD